MVGWGIFFIFLAFFSLISASTSGYEAGIGAAILWAAVGSILIARGRAKRKQREEQQRTIIVNNYTTPLPRGYQGAAVKASSRVVVSRRFPVAGVTFKNDDGTSRQQILREICKGEDDGVTNAWLEWYQYRGEDAYRVMTSAGCVGTVRKNDIVEAVTAIGAKTVDLEIEMFETEDGRALYRADLIADS